MGAKEAFARVGKPIAVGIQPGGEISDAVFPLPDIAELVVVRVEIRENGTGAAAECRRQAHDAFDGDTGVVEEAVETIHGL